MSRDARPVPRGEPSREPSPEPGGDAHAVDVLVEHLGWLERRAARLVGDRALAGDLVQTVCLRVLRRPTRPRRPRAWLATILRNELHQHLRGERRRARREASVAARDGAPPVVDRALARERRRELQRALRALPTPTRRVVRLRYLGSLPPRVIARRLDLPLATVRSRLKRGLRILRGRLGVRRLGLLFLLGSTRRQAWPSTARAAPTAATGATAHGLGVAACLVVACMGVGGSLIGGRAGGGSIDTPRPPGEETVAARGPRLAASPRPAVPRRARGPRILAAWLLEDRVDVTVEHLAFGLGAPRDARPPRPSPAPASVGIEPETVGAGGMADWGP